MVSPRLMIINRSLYKLQITKGLLQKYGPERIRDTPITEVCEQVNGVFLRL